MTETDERSATRAALVEYAESCGGTLRPDQHPNNAQGLILCGILSGRLTLYTAEAAVEPFPCDPTPRDRAHDRTVLYQLWMHDWIDLNPGGVTDAGRLAAKRWLASLQGPTF
ncbi:hypothetical protein [Patulibacter defluvii]|uniref:hypothetical protein n=1 Tax=Patulibacter defluvii TaxID=3095358 RepID=UPI002A75570F|nr:hypothetical protein [Patulibacter sp. DM4]